MITRSTRRKTKTSEIQPKLTEISVNNRIIDVYGTEENPFFPVTKITDWIGENKSISYEFWLDNVKDNDRKIINIKDENGKNHKIWAITENGMYFILKNYKSDNNTYREAIYNTFHSEKVSSNSDSSEIAPKSHKSEQSYSVKEILNNPKVLIQVLTELAEIQEKNKILSEKVDTQGQIISDMQPKAEYYDKILACENVVSISVIASDYGKSAIWLNNKLHNMKIQYRRNGVWFLYSKYADKGYTKTKTHETTDEFGVTHSRVHTYWTQSGRNFIYNILKEQGIEPKTNTDISSDDEVKEKPCEIQEV